MIGHKSLLTRQVTSCQRGLFANSTSGGLHLTRIGAKGHVNAHARMLRSLNRACLYSISVLHGRLKCHHVSFSSLLFIWALDRWPCGGVLR